MTPGPRRPPQDGSQMRVVRKPNLRVRQGVRDNNVPLLNRLQHKVDLRNTDKNRLTSLSWAALEGSLEVFEWLLLDYGHDDQELSRDADNNTILHLLASIPSPPTHSPHTHLLLSSPSFPPRPSTKSLAVQISTSLRMTHLYHTLFPFLLDWSNSGGKTALHVAAQAGNTAFINLLCDVGADVDLTDLQGNTPLHYASAWGHVETIRVLLERGCQFGARNFEGFTASDFAYSATVMGSIQTIARELLEERRNRRKAEADSYSNPPQGRLRSGSASTNLSNGSGLSANMVSPTGGVAAVDRRLGIMTSEADLERPANSYFSNRLGNGRDPNHSPGGPSPTSASPNLQPGSLAAGGFSMRRGDSAQTGSESSYNQAPPNKRMASAPGGRGTPI